MIKYLDSRKALDVYLAKYGYAPHASQFARTEHYLNFSTVLKDGGSVLYIDDVSASACAIAQALQHLCEEAEQPENCRMVLMQGAYRENDMAELKKIFSEAVRDNKSLCVWFGYRKITELQRLTLWELMVPSIFETKQSYADQMLYIMVNDSSGNKIPTERLSGMAAETPNVCLLVVGGQNKMEQLPEGSETSHVQAVRSNTFKFMRDAAKHGVVKLGRMLAVLPKSVYSERTPKKQKPHQP